MQIQSVLKCLLVLVRTFLHRQQSCIRIFQLTDFSRAHTHTFKALGKICICLSKLVSSKNLNSLHLFENGQLCLLVIFFFLVRVCIWMWVGILGNQVFSYAEANKTLPPSFCKTECLTFPTNKPAFHFSCSHFGKLRKFPTPKESGKSSQISLAGDTAVWFNHPCSKYFNLHVCHLCILARK